MRGNALSALIPPPRLRLSDWIEHNIRLPESVSALPGAIRLYPYQREIADAISDPEVERVTLVKPVRVGFTTLLTGAVGAYVANEPSPILVLLPTESDCRDYVVSDIEPIFAATPVLHGALSAESDGEDRNTLLSRRFPGGSLKVVAARAPRNLRRHSARILIVDEADACEAGAEGNPLRLAERRTLSFPNRKIIIGSTPLYEDTSHVLRAYAASDARVYEVPCPACGAFQEIMWPDIEWRPDKPETAAYRCPHCHDLIPERHKAQMVSAGHWRATRPEVVGHAGFRLNALVSLLANASWSKLAAEYITAKDDPAELQTFVNTILGQGWRQAGEELDEAALVARAEPFSLDAIPREVLAITVGCDVQHDRLEATITGWAKDGSCCVLGHEVFWGTPSDAGGEVWHDLDGLLKQRWPHPAGGTLGVDAACVDAGDGGVMDIVTAFAAPRFGRRVFAIKGAPGFSRTFIQRAKISGRPLFIVGVDAIKARLFDRIGNAKAVRFSHTLEPQWFEQLTSEKRVVKMVRGKPVARFERKPGFDAEALDCMVYAHAARAALTLNFDARADALALATETKRQTVFRSEWMQR